MEQESIYEKQLVYNDEAVPVRFISQEREKYYNVPEWQRNPGIWPEHRKQKLINTLLKNGFMPALVMFPDINDFDKLFILDGQQRMCTILDYIDNRFKTGRIRIGRPGENYLEPHRYFRELGDSAQKRILNFRLRYSVLQETNPTRLRGIYIDLQNLSQLKTAEILYASDTYARSTALRLMDHPYIHEIYAGEDKRHEIFQMIAYPLAIELYGPLVHMDSARIGGILQAGVKDSAINEELIERIEENLLYAQHLFKNTRTQSILSIVIHYQAVVFLRLCGYDLNSAEAGCLSEWFGRINSSPAYKQSSGTFVYKPISREHSSFSQIHRFGFQHVFWSQHLAEIALVVENGNFEDITRLCSWLHLRHICPVCAQGVRLQDIKSHGFKLDDSQENCSK